jgi:hypothetical protein
MTSMMTGWGPPCALVGFLSVAGAATETRAAYWNYACKGAIGEAELLFDRNYLVVMPKKLAQGGVLGIRDGSIGAFESVDENSGLAPTMVFSRGDKKITLVETSSKQTSDKDWTSGRRFWSRTTFIKRYRIRTIISNSVTSYKAAKAIRIKARSGWNASTTTPAFDRLSQCEAARRRCAAKSPVLSRPTEPGRGAARRRGGPRSGWPQLLRGPRGSGRGIPPKPTPHILESRMRSKDDNPAKSGSAAASQSGAGDHGCRGGGSRRDSKSHGCRPAVRITHGRARVRCRARVR